MSNEVHFLLMLNVFPIQYLAPLAYVLLRVVLGVLLIRTGIRLCSSPFSILRILIGVLEMIIGSMLVFGFYTQIAAIGSMGIAFLGLLRVAPFYGTLFSRSTALLMGAISLSLFITGAGPLAFDLPI